MARILNCMRAMDDLRSAWMRYRAAFDAHQAIAAANAKRCTGGAPISPELDLLRERRALNDLNTARRALLAGLAH